MLVVHSNLKRLVVVGVVLLMFVFRFGGWFRPGDVILPESVLVRDQIGFNCRAIRRIP